MDGRNSITARRRYRRRVRISRRPTCSNTSSINSGWLVAPEWARARVRGWRHKCRRIVCQPGSRPSAGMWCVRGGVLRLWHAMRSEIRREIGTRVPRSRYAPIPLETCRSWRPENSCCRICNHRTVGIIPVKWRTPKAAINCITPSRCKVII